MRQRRLLGILTAACALAVSACGGSAATGGSSGQGLVSGGTLTMGISTDPGNLDPQQTALSIDNQVAQLAYDPLIQESATGSIVSGLASAWRESGNSATFTLKKGATCSDGSPVTPSLIAANIAYLANPKNKSPLLGVFVPPGITAHAGNGTVTLSWPKPFPFVLQALTSVPIVCQKGLADRGKLAHGTDGTGPYVLSAAVPNSQYTYTVRKGYAWGPGGAATSARGMPAKVVLKVVSNETTAANLLLGGQLNIASVIGSDRSRLAAARLFSREALVNLGEMEFNEAGSRPTADENVRRALTMALNLPQLRQVITAGNGTTPPGLVTLKPAPCHAGTVQGHLPSQNLAAAQRLLSQAGWTPGPGGVRQKGGKKLALTLLYPSAEGTPASDAAQLAARAWAKLGAQVHPQGVPDTQLSSVIFGTGAWEIGWIPLTIQFPSDAVPFFSGAVPPAGTDFGHISNPAYDRLTAQAAGQPGATGCPQWDQAEQALYQRADVIPFAAQTEPVWAKNATFQLGGNGPIPTSLRLLGS
ncbi:MAG TPA: ABC transporter substrate-binding protein [Streptosporangiaceae bacterium]|nr:ABC transporter substrate-binding protein [Streptosporangiaceae bacterium]